MFGPSHDLELLHQWMDECGPPTPAASVEDLAVRLFITRLVCRDVNYEWTFQGCSFSQKGTSVLLVVKAMRDGIPYVAYTTERTPTRCIVGFTRAWLQERVKWSPDKYRKV